MYAPGVSFRGIDGAAMFPYILCFEGWFLQFGKVCAAPSSYTGVGCLFAVFAYLGAASSFRYVAGPCEHTAYMSGATVADKKAFEATVRSR
jgi:hypothetical protein